MIRIRHIVSCSPRIPTEPFRCVDHGQWNTFLMRKDGDRFYAFSRWNQAARPADLAWQRKLRVTPRLAGDVHRSQRDKNLEWKRMRRQRKRHSVMSGLDEVPEILGEPTRVLKKVRHFRGQYEQCGIEQVRAGVAPLQDVVE